uniref:HYR domain-containing protein n=1 Tax=Chromera velia CCMP2878 TaxID=1169474 RepID=A0A0G4HP15_9ALVE|eukprot:Cvel_7716.t1-p1 / transcript=Cvel_7716.t1 / gene=Cvel_7716 / organism=Chromera_velia_CCMP2878 / gene_product=Probable E3 ubiquitin-protein ligase HERC1, putative / transcript_product=Probable E3 ubiquitin-protein ligase HERC1, putative / location=Cvel_scaffold410:20058-36226(+) / protein_length=3463 / sequence_SO=supercontig / SO=protein_coding / is_pseudo=false
MVVVAFRLLALLLSLCSCLGAEGFLRLVPGGGAGSLVQNKNDNNHQNETTCRGALGSVNITAQGTFHSFLVDTNGRLLGFGRNLQGQLGVGDFENRYAPTEVGGGSLGGFRAVCGGEEHSLAVTLNGTLVSFGSNWAGQLGVGRGVRNSSVPIRIQLPLSEGDGEVVGVACGSFFSAAWTPTALFMWGRNDMGQLGLGGLLRDPGDDTGERAEADLVRFLPQRVGGALANRDIHDVAAGHKHTLALTSPGRQLYAWGNWKGTDDDIVRFPPSTEPELVTVQHNPPNPQTTQSQTSSSNPGEPEGEAAAPGGEREGESGGGDGRDTHRESQQPMSPPEVVLSIAAGGRHSLVLTHTASLYAFGRNDHGQLGVGGERNLDSPTRVPLPAGAVEVAAGEIHSLVRLGDGRLIGFGGNTYGSRHGMLEAVGAGQLGLDTDHPQSEPREISLGGAVMEIDENARKALFRGGSGSWHSLVRVNGGVVAAGWGNDGQLGQELKRSAVFRRIPSLDIDECCADFHNCDEKAVCTNTPGSFTCSCPAGFAETGGGKLCMGRVKSVGLGSDHTLLVDHEGDLFAFGNNQVHQLGLDASTLRRRGQVHSAHSPAAEEEPVRVAALRHVNMTCGGDGYSLALSEEGILYSWGRRLFASPSPSPQSWLLIQEGIQREEVEAPIEIEQRRETEIPSPTPAAVSDSTVEGEEGYPPSPIPPAEMGAEEKAFSGGAGAGAGGTVGDELTDASPVPFVVQLPFPSAELEEGQPGGGGGERVVGIACGSLHSAAWTDRGRLYTWGVGSHGQLGREVERESPAERESRVTVGGATVAVAKGTPPQMVEALSGQKIVGAAGGNLHTLAWTDAGRLFFFGRQCGNVGDPLEAGGGAAGVRSFVPREVPLPEGMRAVSAAGGGKKGSVYGHSLVVTDDGSLLSFGSEGPGGEGLGQLGTRHQQHGLSSPRRLLSPPKQCDVPSLVRLPVQAEGVKVVEVAAGDHHSLARLEDGRVFGFGGNQEGQLGLGGLESTKRSGPVEVEGLRAEKLFVGGAQSVHSVVLLAGGPAASGNNDGGRLGLRSLDVHLFESLASADTQECAFSPPLHNCDRNAKCVETVGSFECLCNEGFSGDGINCLKPSVVCPERLRQCTEPGVRFFRATTIGISDAIFFDPPDASLTFIPAVENLFDWGVNHTVLVTVTDSGGNTATCNFTLEVVDEEGPLLTCPLSSSVNETVLGMPPITYEEGAVAVRDNVDSPENVSLSFDPPNGTAFPVGASFVTVTVTGVDGSGNEGKCQFMVTANKCPPNAERETPNGECVCHEGFYRDPDIWESTQTVVCRACAANSRSPRESIHPSACECMGGFYRDPEPFEKSETVVCKRCIPYSHSPDGAVHPADCVCERNRYLVPELGQSDTLAGALSRRIREDGRGLAVFTAGDCEPCPANSTCSGLAFRPSDSLVTRVMKNGAGRGNPYLDSEFFIVGLSGEEAAERDGEDRRQLSEKEAADAEAKLHRPIETVGDSRRGKPLEIESPEMFQDILRRLLAHSRPIPDDGFSLVQRWPEAVVAPCPAGAACVTSTSIPPSFSAETSAPRIPPPFLQEAFQDEAPGTLCGEHHEGPLCNECTPGTRLVRGGRNEGCRQCPPRAQTFGFAVLMALLLTGLVVLYTWFVTKDFPHLDMLEHAVAVKILVVFVSRLGTLAALAGPALVSLRDALSTKLHDGQIRLVASSVERHAQRVLEIFQEVPTIGDLFSLDCLLLQTSPAGADRVGRGLLSLAVPVGIICFLFLFGAVIVFVGFLKSKKRVSEVPMVVTQAPGGVGPGGEDGGELISNSGDVSEGPGASQIQGSRSRAGSLTPHQILLSPFPEVQWSKKKTPTRDLSRAYSRKGPHGSISITSVSTNCLNPATSHAPSTLAPPTSAVSHTNTHWVGAAQSECATGFPEKEDGGSRSAGGGGSGPEAGPLNPSGSLVSSSRLYRSTTVRSTLGSTGVAESAAAAARASCDLSGFGSGSGSASCSAPGFGLPGSSAPPTGAAGALGSPSFDLEREGLGGGERDRERPSGSFALSRSPPCFFSKGSPPALARMPTETEREGGQEAAGGDTTRTGTSPPTAPRNNLTSTPAGLCCGVATPIDEKERESAQKLLHTQQEDSMKSISMAVVAAGEREAKERELETEAAVRLRFERRLVFTKRVLWLYRPHFDRDTPWWVMVWSLLADLISPTIVVTFLWGDELVAAPLAALRCEPLHPSLTHDKRLWASPSVSCTDATFEYRQRRLIATSLVVFFALLLPISLIGLLWYGRRELRKMTREAAERAEKSAPTGKKQKEKNRRLPAGVPFTCCKKEFLPRDEDTGRRRMGTPADRLEKGVCGGPDEEKGLPGVSVDYFGFDSEKQASSLPRGSSAGSAERDKDRERQQAPSRLQRGTGRTQTAPALPRRSSSSSVAIDFFRSAFGVRSSSSIDLAETEAASSVSGHELTHPSLLPATYKALMIQSPRMRLALFRRHLSLVLGGYKESYFYWELVVFARRMTLPLCFLQGNAGVRLDILTLHAATFLILQMTVRPYNSTFLNTMEANSLGVWLFIVGIFKFISDEQVPIAVRVPLIYLLFILFAAFVIYYAGWIARAFAIQVYDRIFILQKRKEEEDDDYTHHAAASLQRANTGVSAKSVASSGSQAHRMKCSKRVIRQFREWGVFNFLLRFLSVFQRRVAVKIRIRQNDKLTPKITHVSRGRKSHLFPSPTIVGLSARQETMGPRFPGPRHAAWGNGGARDMMEGSKTLRAFAWCLESVDPEIDAVNLSLKTERARRKGLMRLRQSRGMFRKGSATNGPGPLMEFCPDLNQLPLMESFAFRLAVICRVDMGDRQGGKKRRLLANVCEEPAEQCAIVRELLSDEQGEPQPPNTQLLLSKTGLNLQQQQQLRRDRDREQQEREQHPRQRRVRSLTQATSRQTAVSIGTGTGLTDREDIRPPPPSSSLSLGGAGGHFVHVLPPPETSQSHSAAIPPTSAFAYPPPFPTLAEDAPPPSESVAPPTAVRVDDADAEETDALSPPAPPPDARLPRLQTQTQAQQQPIRDQACQQQNVNVEKEKERLLLHEQPPLWERSRSSSGHSRYASSSSDCRPPPLSPTPPATPPPTGFVRRRRTPSGSGEAVLKPPRLCEDAPLEMPPESEREENIISCASPPSNLGGPVCPLPPFALPSREYASSSSAIAVDEVEGEGGVGRGRGVEVDGPLCVRQRSGGASASASSSSSDSILMPDSRDRDRLTLAPPHVDDRMRGDRERERSESIATASGISELPPPLAACLAATRLHGSEKQGGGERFLCPPGVATGRVLPSLTDNSRGSSPNISVSRPQSDPSQDDPCAWTEEDARIAELVFWDRLVAAFESPSRLNGTGFGGHRKDPVAEWLQRHANSQERGTFARMAALGEAFFSSEAAERAEKTGEALRDFRQGTRLLQHLHPEVLLQIYPCFLAAAYVRRLAPHHGHGRLSD